MRRALWVSLVMVALFRSGRAAADEYFEMSTTDKAVFGTMVAGVVACAAMLPLSNIGVGVANIQNIRKGVRPSWVQLMAGSALGFALIGGGSAFLLEGISQDSTALKAIGAVGLSVAAFDLTTTIWAMTLPGRRAVRTIHAAGLAPVATGRQFGLLYSRKF